MERGAQVCGERCHIEERTVTRHPPSWSSASGQGPLGLIHRDQSAEASTLRMDAPQATNLRSFHTRPMSPLGAPTDRTRWMEQPWVQERADCGRTYYMNDRTHLVFPHLSVWTPAEPQAQKGARGRKLPVSGMERDSPRTFGADHHSSPTLATDCWPCCADLSGFEN